MLEKCLSVSQSVCQTFQKWRKITLSSTIGSPVFVSGRSVDSRGPCRSSTIQSTPTDLTNNNTISSDNNNINRISNNNNGGLLEMCEHLYNWPLTSLYPLKSYVCSFRIHICRRFVQTFSILVFFYAVISKSLKLV